MTVSYCRYGDDARARLFAGVKLLADAVRVTIGPSGRVVLLDEEVGAPRVTGDGARIAEAIELEDRCADMGSRLVRNAATRTSDEAGDGRTTATILAAAILGEGIRAIGAGAHPVALKRGIDRGVEMVSQALRDVARPVEPGPALAVLAAVAAGGDDRLGAIVADAVAQVGAEGVVTVEGGNTLESECEIVTGLRFDQGYVSPYFMTDAESLLCEYDNPLILLFDGKLDRHEPLLRLLEAAVVARRPLVIIAEAIEGEALQTLTTNKVKGGLRLVAVKGPHFGERRRAALEDAAVLTGATVIAEDKGLSLIDAGLDCLGGARRVVISKDETLIVEGAGDQAAIEDRCAEVRGRLEQARTDYDRRLITDRLARLTGGVGILRVGGGSEAEIATRSESARDAIRAARAALEGGVVAGGGAALFHAGRTLAAQSGPDDHAARVLIAALAAPLRQIAENAGHDGRAVEAQLAETGGAGDGFDAARGVIGPMHEAGIVDPLGVVLAALRNAASVAGLILTAEAALAKPPPPPLAPGEEAPLDVTTPDFRADELAGFGLA